MKRPLVDVNVVLDALLDRVPHGGVAGTLWAAAERKRLEALVPAHGVTTLHYLVRQAKGEAAARSAVEAVLSVFGVAPVTASVLGRAVSLGFSDLEDAVCAAAAEAAGCDLIVTRDPRGFRRASVPVVDVETAVSLLRESSGPRGVSERAVRYERSGRRRRRD